MRYFLIFVAIVLSISALGTLWGVYVNDMEWMPAAAVVAFVGSIAFAGFGTLFLSIFLSVLRILWGVLPRDMTQQLVEGIDYFMPRRRSRTDQKALTDND
ncbi:hypothetical protein [Pseudaestuariivita rosea]|uniref:hypothetical protein n=1 Tax=Pseudaestuariivita rosea TaxID=2763263 RepID=UPI001ABB9C7E|nr:hypothetical protein [Pseudaestuariivita rosea]